MIPSTGTVTIGARVRYDTTDATKKDTLGNMFDRRCGARTVESNQRIIATSSVREALISRLSALGLLSTAGNERCGYAARMHH